MSNAVKNINRHVVLGRLGADPELRYTQNGKAILTLSVATSNSYKDKGGNWQERTNWQKIIMFDKRAEKVAGQARKGSLIYIEGEVETRSYEQDGQKRYITETVVKYGGEAIVLNPLESQQPQQQKIAEYDDEYPF